MAARGTEAVEDHNGQLILLSPSRDPQSVGKGIWIAFFSGREWPRAHREVQVRPRWKTSCCRGDRPRMEVVSKASQIILLVEDSLHELFVFRYLRKLEYGVHAMRIVKSPSGAGSGEQWVRERFAIERDACRRRQAETKLIVVIDAGIHTVQHRIAQLDLALREGGAPAISNGTTEIARLVLNAHRNLDPLP